MGKRMTMSWRDDTALKTRADYMAAIERCLAELQRLQEHRIDHQTELDRLRDETRALLATMQTP